MKGLSILIMSILIVLLVSIFVTASFVLFNRIFTRTTSVGTEIAEKESTRSSFVIDSVSNSGNIYIRNVGNTNVSNIVVYVDEQIINAEVTPPVIKTGEIGVIRPYYFRKIDNIRITTAEGLEVTKTFTDMSFCGNFSIILCMLFDEGSGSMARDSSRYGNDGQIEPSTPNWVAGRFGKALNFDGSTYINIPNLVGMDNPATFTIEAWLRISSTAAFDSVVFRGDDVTNYSLFILSSSRTPGVVYIDNVENFHTATADPPSALSLNRDYYIAITVDPIVARQIKIFINGNLVKTGVADIPIGPTTRNHYIGIGTAGFDSSLLNEFYGRIDELRIWNVALSDEEIRKSYLP